VAGNTGVAGDTGVAGGAGLGQMAAGGQSGLAGALAGVGGSVAAGSGGVTTAGTGGSSGSIGTAGSGPTTDGVKQPCLKDPKNVVFIGDSYIDYAIAHLPLYDLVADRAVMDGALKAGQAYTNKAVAGTTMAADGILAKIPTQWDAAKASNKMIQLVIMDGGGNDVLISNMQCKAVGSAKNATCQKVVEDTLTAATKMITDMKASGVTEVIYFFYPHAPTGGAEMTDYTLPLLRARCASVSDASFQCRIVDLVPVFEGHPEWYASDDIHANTLGEGKIADVVYKQMKDDCVGQPASSGCCAP
jgi:lysophospholipase L1-like esterase